GQRAAGTVGTEGVSHDPCEKLAYRGWGGLGRHHHRPHGDREVGSPERPDDDRVRQGLLAMGGPPRQDTPTDRLQHVEHAVAPAESLVASWWLSKSVNRHRAAPRSPLISMGGLGSGPRSAAPSPRPAAGGSTAARVRPAAVGRGG